MFILASASPRRIEMLKNAGYDPIVKPASIIESLPFEMSPETATMYLALSKADHIFNQLLNSDSHISENTTILAADTVVVNNGIIIGKPADKSEAYNTLSSLSGNSHHVITGCCVIKHSFSNTVKACFYEDTEVFFKNIPDLELLAYVDTDEPYDKAGGYAIQGTFSKYIDHIIGDMNNVIGLPLYRLKQYI